MKERPILFSAPMIRALLAGTKTQTRRKVKQATGLSLSVEQHPTESGKAVLSWLIGDGPGYPVMEQVKVVDCPYGQVGDRLWVREAWQVDAPCDGTWHDTAWYGCKGSPLSEIPARFQHPNFCNYAANWIYGDIVWRSPIFMPRWASRILLEIVSVRVERLQEISEADAEAEGVQCDSDGWFYYQMPSTQCCVTAVDSYQTLWSQINGTGSWILNPYVWGLEFRRVTP